MSAGGAAAKGGALPFISPGPVLHDLLISSNTTNFMPPPIAKINCTMKGFSSPRGRIEHEK